MSDTLLAHEALPESQLTLENRDNARAQSDASILREPQPGEESELIVVALQFTPLCMECGDEGFRILNAEGADCRAIPLADPSTS